MRACTSLQRLVLSSQIIMYGESIMRSCVAGYEANAQCTAYASVHGRQAVPTRPFRRTSCSGKQIACTSQKPDDSFAFKPRKRTDWQDGPSFQLTREQAVLKQLQALQRNNQPSPDHGIEVLYRFANFDPFSRSVYFGVNRDLGQFERFRRIFHTPSYSILLGHLQHTPLSCLKVSEFRWKQRVWVKGYKTGEEGVFEFSMVQRFGGHYDGTWFTDQLTCDDCH